MVSIFKKSGDKKYKHCEQEKYNTYVSNDLIFMWGAKLQKDFTNNPECETKKNIIN